MRRYLVAREGGPATPYFVRDDQGPRDAAINYAEHRETGEAVLLVSEDEFAAKVTRWRVEPVTTYRAIAWDVVRLAHEELELEALRGRR